MFEFFKITDRYIDLLGKLKQFWGKVMPDRTGCVTCGDLTFDVQGTEGEDWLACIEYTGVALKVPRGVWFQKPETEIFDFIKKVDGKLPEDTLEWEVDEDKVKKYQNIFGSQGMLFSENQVTPDSVHGMGITREQWMERQKQQLPNDQEFCPDPIVLLAVARAFWRKYGGGAVLHTPSGESIHFGWDTLMKLKTEKEDPLQRIKQLKEMLDAKLITNAEYRQKKKEILSLDKESPAQKLKQLKEMLDAELITEAEFNSKKAEIISRI